MASFYREYSTSPQEPSAASWDVSTPIKYDVSTKCDWCLSDVWSRRISVFAHGCQCEKEVHKEQPEGMGPIRYNLLEALSKKGVWSEAPSTLRYFVLKHECERAVVPVDVECTCFSTGYFASLPQEIILKIFSCFSQRQLGQWVAPVCHHWMHSAYDPIFWKEMKFEMPIDAALLSAVCVRRGSLTQELSIEMCDNFTSVHMDLIGRECPLLKVLALDQNLNIDSEVVHSISTHCVNLIELHLPYSRLVDYNCIIYLSALKSLKTLNLSHCTRLLDDSIVRIARNFESLESLKIDGLQWLMDSTIEELAHCRWRTLKSLDVDGAELTDQSTRVLSKCHLLERYSQSFCELLTDQSLENLKALPNLKELRLRKGFDFSSFALESLFSHPCTNNLTYLNLKESIQLMDNGVMAICKGCGPSLKVLKLCWCWNVTDLGLEAIVNTCRNLEELDILGMDQIRGDCLAKVPTKLPALKLLNLSQCNQIRDEMIFVVIFEKPSLKVFNYFGENFLADFG